MKYFLNFMAFCFLANLLGAQAQENRNEILVDYINTVQFHPEGFVLNSPLIALNSSSRLELSFDDFTEDVQDYIYTITLMDKNWQREELSAIEYLDGFEENQIEQFEFSFNTIVGFTNYKLYLPNEDITWTKSGNYLLEVFNEDADRELVFRQRFVVFEQEVNIIPEMLRPAIASKIRTHQEIDFTVDYERFPIRNPKTELSATIIQNERWDNAIIGIPPTFLRAQAVAFDYQDKIIFPAGREFRYLDIRDFKFDRGNVAEIKRGRDFTEIYLKLDGIRAGRSVSSFNDLNGDFVIEDASLRSRLTASSIDSVYSNRNQYNNRTNQFDLNCDYADVFFFLDDQPYSSKSIHVLGAFNQWLPTEENKLEYSKEANAFVGRLFLKQGYYDYAYGLVDRKSQVIDLSEIEGNAQETQNEYTILIYHRAFGQRYDRVIGTVTFTSDL